MKATTRKQTLSSALTIATLLALTGCSQAPATASMSALEHVHGLGVDPGSGDLLAATHQGVWRVQASGLGAGFSTRPTARIGEGTQDTMGFTIIAPGRMLASGHPDPVNNPEGDPGNLGLIESTDAAHSWKPVSLRGEADFHDLTAAPLPDNAQRIYGYSGGTIRVSDDSGHTWRDGATLALPRLAVDPTDAATVYATTETGLKISHDAGFTFAPVADAPPLFLLEATSDSANRMWVWTHKTPTWVLGDDNRWQKREEFVSLPESI